MIDTLAPYFVVRNPSPETNQDTSPSRLETFWKQLAYFSATTLAIILAAMVVYGLFLEANFLWDAPAGSLFNELVTGAFLSGGVALLSAFLHLGHRVISDH
jgi:hypothetical protein